MDCKLFICANAASYSKESILFWWVGSCKALFSPWLFLFYNNDLFQLDLENQIISFADDTKLFGTVNENCCLQSDLSKVLGWCEENLMELNVAKCKCIHFGTKNPDCSYIINDQHIEIVTFQKDLGVMCYGPEYSLAQPSLGMVPAIFHLSCK